MKTLRLHILPFAAIALFVLFLACDDSGSSDTVPRNQAPEADTIKENTVMNKPVVVTCTAHDDDGDPLVFSLGDVRPEHGSLVRTGAATWRYEPDDDFTGDDMFTYKVNDGLLDSNIATVSIKVGADPDLPVAQEIYVIVEQGGQIDITLLGSAHEWDTLTYRISSNPAHGSLAATVDDDRFVYEPFICEPSEEYVGPDSFTYRVGVVGDDSRISAAATVHITIIESGNIAPEADEFPCSADDQETQCSTSEDPVTPLSITLQGIDRDNGPSPLTYELVSEINEAQAGPFNGTIIQTGTDSGPDITYMPDPDFNGPDFFAYRVCDGASCSDPVEVTIQVAPVNDPPVAHTLYVNTTVNTELKIELVGEDIERDILSYVITMNPSIDPVNDIFEKVPDTINEWTFKTSIVKNYNFRYQAIEQNTDPPLSSIIVDVYIEVTPPGTLYVSPDGSENGDGRSWHSASDHPARAMEKAAEMVQSLGPDDDNIEIWVAGNDNTPYAPLDGYSSVVDMEPRVTIIGGFAGWERDSDERPSLLDGTLSNNTTLNGNGIVPHVVIGADNSVIDGFTITGGNANGEGNDARGGGIYNDNCAMRILNCEFTGNHASYGGAIYNGEGSGASITGGLVIDGCTFTGNHASLDGGAVFNAENSTVTITSSVFDANGADWTGGALCSLSAVTVNDCNFNGNSAESGGAVYDYNEASVFTGCSFDANSAETGGAVFNTGPITITADTENDIPCTFSNNRADYGGAVYNDSSGITGGIYNEAVFNDVDFASNTASVSGGAAYNKRCTPIFAACSFSAAEDDDQPASAVGGGAVYGEWCYTSFNDCSFTLMTAERGGAVYADRGSLECDGCEFIRCGFATETLCTRGGAAYVTGGIATVFSGCTFSYGRARHGAGAYFDEGTSADIAGCTFTGNSANYNGGGAYFATASPADFTDCRLSGNTAGAGGISGNGGGVCLAGPGEYSFINCLIAGNTGYYGAGIYGSGATLTILHATMAGNDSSGYTNGGIHFSGGSAAITNSVLWGIFYNDTVKWEPVVTGTPALLNITYCDISQEEYQENTGCKDQQPRFIGGSHPYMMDYEYTVTDSSGDETTETSENLDAGTGDLDQEVLELLNGRRSLDTQYDYLINLPVGFSPKPDIGYHY